MLTSERSIQQYWKYTHIFDGLLQDCSISRTLALPKRNICLWFDTFCLTLFEPLPTCWLGHIRHWSMWHEGTHSDRLAQLEHDMLSKSCDRWGRVVNHITGPTSGRFHRYEIFVTFNIGFSDGTLTTLVIIQNDSQPSIGRQGFSHNF